MTIKFPELDEKVGKLDDIQKKINTAMTEGRGGAEGTLDMSLVKSIDGTSAEKADTLNQWNKEANALRGEIDSLKGVQGLSEAQMDFQERHGRAADFEDSPSTKSLGDMISRSNAARQKGSTDTVDVQLKTLFETSAGWAPESTRSGRVVLDAQRPIQVTDVLPSIPTSQAAYKYMEETTFTNNAAERSEGGAYVESALELTERSVIVESIGTFLPVTDEQLEDEAGAAAYIDARLPFMVRQRLDSQILVGDGNTPNVLGINNKGSVQTQAKGSDPVPDAIHKGITKVKVTGRAMPNAVVMHPNDWQDIRLLRTTDGIYIWGSPSEAGVPRIWGVNVVETDAQTENTAVVGDFANYSLLVVRRGIEVKVSDSHSDYFVKGKQAIRAGMRAATVWLRPEAFCKVTGI